MPDVPSPPLPACLTASSFAGHPPHLSTSNPSLATEILPGPPPLAAIAPPLGKTTASTNHHIRKSGNVLTYLPAMDPGSTYVNQLAGPAASGQVVWTPPPAVPLPVQPAQQQMQHGDDGEQSGSRKRKRARVDKPPPPPSTRPLRNSTIRTSTPATSAVDPEQTLPSAEQTLAQPATTSRAMPEGRTTRSAAAASQPPPALASSDGALGANGAPNAVAPDQQPMNQAPAQPPPTKKQRTGQLKGKAREDSATPAPQGAQDGAQQPYFYYQANHDSCSACLSPNPLSANVGLASLERDQGGGSLLYCDGCPRSFHFLCLDPPLDVDNVPEGGWWCPSCQAKNAQPAPLLDPSEAPKLLDPLMDHLKQNFPREFQLPDEIRGFFKDVLTGPRGGYIDARNLRTQKGNRAPATEERDPFRLKDRNGKPVLCYRCGKSALCDMSLSVGLEGEFSQQRPAGSLAAINGRASYANGVVVGDDDSTVPPSPSGSLAELIYRSAPPGALAGDGERSPTSEGVPMEGVMMTTAGPAHDRRSSPMPTTRATPQPSRASPRPSTRSSPYPSRSARGSPHAGKATPPLPQDHQFPPTSLPAYPPQSAVPDSQLPPSLQPSSTPPLLSSSMAPDEPPPLGSSIPQLQSQLPLVHPPGRYPQVGDNQYPSVPLLTASQIAAPIPQPPPPPPPQPVPQPIQQQRNGGPNTNANAAAATAANQPLHGPLHAIPPPHPPDPVNLPHSTDVAALRKAGVNAVDDLLANRGVLAGRVKEEYRRGIAGGGDVDGDDDMMDDGVVDNGANSGEDRRMLHSFTSESVGGTNGAGMRPIVSCDHCNLHWHLDCTDPPLAGMPAKEKKWMCPVHLGEILFPKPRLPKIPPQATVVNQTGQYNNGNIEVIPGPLNLGDVNTLASSSTFAGGIAVGQARAGKHHSSKIKGAKVVKGAGVGASGVGGGAVGMMNGVLRSSLHGGAVNGVGAVAAGGGVNGSAPHKKRTGANNGGVPHQVESGGLKMDDVWIGGKRYRIPERVIVLDFWARAKGGPGTVAGAGKREDDDLSIAGSSPLTELSEQEDGDLPELSLDAQHGSGVAAGIDAETWQAAELLAALGRRQLSLDQPHGLLLDIDPTAVSEKDKQWMVSLFRNVAKELAHRNGASADPQPNGADPVVKMDVDGATDRVDLTRTVPADAPSWLTTVLHTLGEPGPSSQPAPVSQPAVTETTTTSVGPTTSTHPPEHDSPSKGKSGLKIRIPPSAHHHHHQQSQKPVSKALSTASDATTSTAVAPASTSGGGNGGAASSRSGPRRSLRRQGSGVITPTPEPAPQPVSPKSKPTRRGGKSGGNGNGLGTDSAHSSSSSIVLGGSKLEDEDELPINPEELKELRAMRELAKLKGAANLIAFLRS